VTQFQVCHVQCDRCGYEDDAPNSSRPARWTQFRPPPSPPAGSANLDLCPACTDAFWQWYSRKAEIEAGMIEQGKTGP
jgi:hypothetical protein